MSRPISWLLNAAYLLLILALLPWLAYQGIAKQKYRAGIAQKLFGLVPRRGGERPCIWLHAVSVGEVNLLGSLLAQIDHAAPHVECVISTTTVTGYALARTKYPHRTVFYCPLDFSWAVHRALARIRPCLLVLAELEVWPNLISIARRRGVRIAVVNGRLSDHSFRGYRRIRWAIAPIFGCLDLIAAQTPEYAERFRALGVPDRALHVTGSMKFDGASFDRQNSATRQLAQLAGIDSKAAVFLAGSTGEPEESIALEVFSRLASRFPSLRLILVPRHPERFDEVARLLMNSRIPFTRRTALSGHEANRTRVLLVDTVGELSAWWGTARIAFVGGSLNRRGGQNMIEPAAYGAALSFGPNTRNFRDIVTLLVDRKAAVVVRDAEQLTAFVEHCLTDYNYAVELGRRARQVAAEGQGATRRTVKLLLPLLNSTGQCCREAA